MSHEEWKVLEGDFGYNRNNNQYIPQILCLNSLTDGFGRRRSIQTVPSAASSSWFQWQCQLWLP